MQLWRQQAPVYSGLSPFDISLKEVSYFSGVLSSSLSSALKGTPLPVEA